MKENPTMPIRLVLADVHPLMLRGLESLLTMEEGFTILASCVNGKDALKAVHEYLPDILILDILLPGKDGLAVLKEIHDQSLPVSVVLFTAAANEKQAIDSLQYGVKGIVLKERTPKFLVQCLRKVHCGSQCMGVQSFRLAMDILLRREKDLRAIQQRLSHREIEVAKMVAKGLRNKAIGEKLFISEGTVKLHIHKIYKKLNLQSRMDLFRYAQDTGLA